MTMRTDGIQSQPKLNYINCVYLLQDAVSHGIVQRDSEIKDNVLVYRGAGPEEPEGWYSENLMSLAQELRNDPNGQKELLSAYKDKTGAGFPAPGDSSLNSILFHSSTASRMASA